jgi:hypothetical protein
VRRRTGFFAEQRGREKRRGKWGSQPGRAKEGGCPTCTRSGAPADRGLNRGGNGAPKSGPQGLQCRTAVKISFKIKSQMDSNHIQILSNFDISRKDPPEMEKFEIKYVCEGFKEGNIFLQRNVFRFEMYFKLKFRGSKV